MKFFFQASFSFFLFGCFYFSSVWGKTQIVSVLPESQKKFTQLEVIFQPLYAGVPRFEPGQGLARIIFPGATVDKKFTTLPIHNGFINQIQFSKVANDVVLEVEYQDILFSSAGKVDLESTDKSWFIKFNTENSLGTLGLPAPLLSTNTKESKVESSALGSIFQVLISLAFVLFLIFVSFKLYQKLLLQRSKLHLNGYQPKIMAVHHLNNKQKIWILRIAETDYALAVSPQSISLLGKLENQNEELILNLSQEEGMNFAKMRAELFFAQKKSEEKKPEKGLLQIHTAQDFKKELQKRLSKFKPIQ